MRSEKGGRLTVVMDGRKLKRSTSSHQEGRHNGGEVHLELWSHRRTDSGQRPKGRRDNARVTARSTGHSGNMLFRTTHVVLMRIGNRRHFDNGWQTDWDTVRNRRFLVR